MSELVLKANYNFLTASDDININFNNQLLNKYLLDNVNITDTTIKGYRVCIKNFLKWLSDNNIIYPTNEDIKKYILYLKTSDYTTATKNQYIRATKHLFKWLSDNNLYNNIALNIKEFRDTKKHKRDSLTPKEIQKIISDIDTSDEVGKRDKAIIILASSLGLRASEVVNIDTKDIEQKDNVYLVSIKGKGYTEKNTKKVIIREVYDAIQDYINSKSIKTDALFTSTSNRAFNKRLTKESLSTIIKNRFKNSGFNSSKLTFHSLRHTTADATLKASDNNIYTTQKYLRHQNTSTTEIYLSEKEDINPILASDVYNEIFNIDAIDKSKELRVLIETLNTDEITDVINYINQIKSNN